MRSRIVVYFLVSFAAAFPAGAEITPSEEVTCYRKGDTLVIEVENRYPHSIQCEVLCRLEGAPVQEHKCTITVPAGTSRPCTRMAHEEVRNAEVSDFSCVAQ